MTKAVRATYVRVPSLVADWLGGAATATVTGLDSAPLVAYPDLLSVRFL